MVSQNIFFLFRIKSKKNILSYVSKTRVDNYYLILGLHTTGHLLRNRQKLLMKHQKKSPLKR